MSDAGAILLFGRLKDVFLTDHIPLPEGATTASNLRTRLAEDYPELADQVMARSVRIAVNQQLVVDEDEMVLTPGDEIALLPPLSGG